jgi:hypothetical protein
MWRPTLVTVAVAAIAACCTTTATALPGADMPYDLQSPQWSYYLEAMRAEAWPACPFRFLSFVDAKNSSLINLWNGNGDNQQFDLVPEKSGSAGARRFRLRASNGGERYLAVTSGACDVNDATVELKAATTAAATAADDDLMLWEATPASQQPGHYTVTSVARAACAGSNTLGFPQTCVNSGPDAVGLVANTTSNGSSTSSNATVASWRFFPASPPPAFIQPRASDRLCPDPFAWFAEDVQEYRLVCTGVWLPLFKATTFNTSTVFAFTGPAISSDHVPKWLNNSARWAPENRLKTSSTEGAANFLLVSDQQPSGPHRVGYAVSRHGPDAQEWDAFSPNFLQLSPGTSGDIDAHFFDDPMTNETYLVWKSDDNRIGMLTTRIWIQKIFLNVSSGTIDQQSEPQVIMDSAGLWWAPSFVTNGTLAEGPEMMYYDGYYYLFFAAGRYDDYSYTEGVARAKSPFGPFEKMMVPLLSTGIVGYNDGKKLQGPGHGALVSVPPNSAEQRHFIIYHAHPAGPKCLRSAYIMEFHFVNGWPAVVAETHQ